MQVCRCAGVQVCRFAGVQVCRCAGVQVCIIGISRTQSPEDSAIYKTKIYK